MRNERFLTYRIVLEGGAKGAVICKSIDIRTRKMYNGRTIRSFQSEVGDG